MGATLYGRRVGARMIEVRQQPGYMARGDWVVLRDGIAIAYFRYDEEHRANGFARREMDGCGQPEGGVKPLG